MKENIYCKNCDAPLPRGNAVYCCNACRNEWIRTHPGEREAANVKRINRERRKARIGDEYNTLVNILRPLQGCDLDSGIALYRAIEKYMREHEFNTRRIVNFRWVADDWVDENRKYSVFINGGKSFDQRRSNVRRIVNALAPIMGYTEKQSPTNQYVKIRPERPAADGKRAEVAA